MAGAARRRPAARARVVVGTGGRGADIDLKLPAHGSVRLGLPDGATYADGAQVLFRSLAGQTVQPWPYDFSSKVKSTDSDVRDLHAQPSDDSAFQP